MGGGGGEGRDRQTKSKPERRGGRGKNERKKDVNGPKPHLQKKMGKEIMIYRMTDRTDRHTNTQPDSKEDLGG